MNAAYLPSRRLGLTSLLAALLTLAACAEPEFILPGERETVRAAAEAVAIAPETVASRSRAIRLPGPTRNAEWAQSAGTPAFRTTNAALARTPRLIWSARIGAGDGRRVRITADPVVAGGLIYTLDSGARVTALTPAGATVWSVDLTPPNDSEGEATGGGMAYADGTLFVSLGFGSVVALEAKSGALRWRQKLRATGSGTPTVVGDLVYLVAGDDTGWAIRKDTGRIEWQVPGTPNITNVLGAPAPALTRDLAIFAFGSGDIAATFRRGGLRRWDATVSGQRRGRAISRISDITGSPMVVGDTIYAGNHSGRIVALAANTGERLWTAREGALGPVWPVGDSLFAVSDRNQLLRLDAANGGVIWAVDLPGYLKDKPRKRAEVVAHYGPIMAGGQVIVASNDGFLRLFSPEDGSLNAKIAVPGGATSAPVVAGGVLYVMGARGELHAFR
jgi:outer membrane protein assembly factor BamB